MNIEEQKKIAKEMGRLYAWRGQTFLPKIFKFDAVLMAEWSKGYAEQCNTMSAEAAKMPLLFADEKAKQ